MSPSAEAGPALPMQPRNFHKPCSWTMCACISAQEIEGRHTRSGTILISGGPCLKKQMDDEKKSQSAQAMNLSFAASHLCRQEASGHLDSIECPSCRQRSVSVWFTRPRKNQYRTWFICAE